MDYVIIAIDEASFQLAPNFKRIWFPKGQKPKGAFFWSNKKLITFAALSSEHKFHYEFYDSQNSITFRHFLKTLVKTLDKNKKYILILDNAAFHKTNLIKDYLAQQTNIIVEHIPPYSPELNPIETCWKVTKNAVTKSQYFKTIDEMQEAIELFWRKHKFTQEFITYLCR